MVFSSSGSCVSLGEAEHWHFLPHLMLVTEHGLTCWGVGPHLFLNIWTTVGAIKKNLYGAVILGVAPLNRPLGK